MTKRECFAASRPSGSAKVARDSCSSKSSCNDREVNSLLARKKVARDDATSKQKATDEKASDTRATAKLPVSAVSAGSAKEQPESEQPESQPLGFSANWLKLKQELGIGPKKRSATAQAVADAESTVQPCKKMKVWFDDVDEELLEPSMRSTSGVDVEQKKKRAQEKLAKANADNGLTTAVAMDCEMVGVGYEGRESILARVSIVNQFGQCIYDSFVKPTEDVTDYRTAVSGVRPCDLQNGKDFSVVQKAVSDILNGRILVGHALHNDLKVLFLDHPRKKIRDTSKYKAFRSLFNGRTPSLKKLTAKVLQVDVQEGEHDSIQDAQAAMRLYTMFKARWEKDIKTAGRQRLLLQVKAGEDAAETKAEKEYTTEYVDDVKEPHPSTAKNGRKKVPGRLRPAASVKTA